MPAQDTNGRMPTGSSGLESSENCSFLFTSESVGEGHPGKKKNSSNKIFFMKKKSLNKIDKIRGKIVKLLFFLFKSGHSGKKKKFLK